MEDITRKLKKLAKLRNRPTLIYKQSNSRVSTLFVDDLPVSLQP
jgi:hypothetical protein